MQDRVPLYPGRVKLNPVSGQANTFDLTRADQPTQEGTPLNKASLLKDATAALFGLDSDAVPDDVLALIKTLIDSANSNANTKLNIETGSYVGTGKYFYTGNSQGSVSNATVVNLGHVPKVFFCGSGEYFVLIVNGALTTAYGNSNTTLVSFTNTVSWYNTNSEGQQLNYAGKTYQYFSLY